MSEDERHKDDDDDYLGMEDNSRRNISQVLNRWNNFLFYNNCFKLNQK